MKKEDGMIEFIFGLAVGTYFAKYTRPLFENLWQAAKGKIVADRAVTTQRKQKPKQKTKKLK
jgi:hypothetical protein